jgi:hypothetical protein
MVILSNKVNSWGRVCLEKLIILQLVKNLMVPYCVDRSLLLVSVLCPISSLHFQLTPWRRVLLEKSTVLQMVKKFPSFFGT